MKEQALALRQLLVQLTPTGRAKNAVERQAKLDMSKAAPSTVSIRSESLDVTPYYNMFAAGTNASKANTAAAQSNPQPVPAASAPGVQQEPAPISLPFQQLSADLKIDRLYMRDVAISNWAATVTIRTNTVQLRPFQLGINGGSM